MSEAERKAFVDCVRWIASHEASENGTWFPLIEQAETEAARRYSAPPPGNGGLRETLERLINAAYAWEEWMLSLDPTPGKGEPLMMELEAAVTAHRKAALAP